MIETWTVEQVMTTPAYTVGFGAGFKEIARTLEQHHISALPVVDELGRLQGVVSEADLLLKEERAGDGGLVAHDHHRRTPDALEKAEGQVAWQLMTTDGAAVRPRTPLPEAARRMRELGVKRLVVTDEDGCVVGIVSRSDLLRVFLRDDDDIQRDVETVMHDLLWLTEDDLSARTEEGVVTFRGRVPRRSEAESLRDITHRLPGVVALRGEVMYDEDDLGRTPDPRTAWFDPHFFIRSSRSRSEPA